MIDPVQKNKEAGQATKSRNGTRKHGTVVLIRTRHPQRKINVTTKAVSDNRVTWSRNTIPMILGVNSALASCTASNKAEAT
jgi:hypothetical protein